MVVLGAFGATLAAFGLWILRGRRIDHEARLRNSREVSENKALAQAQQLGDLQADGIAAGELAQKVGLHGPSTKQSLFPMMSEPTRLVVGLCLLLVGYHALAFALPAAWLPLRFPLDKLWLLAVGVVCAIALSFTVDRLTDSKE